MSRTQANMAPSTAINGSLGTALLSGGPVASLWGWLAVALISVCIALSLAELCSAWPHAAGQALWSFQLAPPRWAPFLSYWTAWWNIAVRSAVSSFRLQYRKPDFTLDTRVDGP